MGESVTSSSTKYHSDKTKIFLYRWKSRGTKVNTYEDILIDVAVPIFHRTALWKML